MVQQFSRRVIAGLSVMLTSRKCRPARSLGWNERRVSAVCSGGAPASWFAGCGTTQGFHTQIDAEQAGSFVLGQPAPERISSAPVARRSAVVDGRATAADGLGLGDASLAGRVAFIGRMEEGGGVHAAAGRWICQFQCAAGDSVGRLMSGIAVFPSISSSLERFVR